MRNDKVGDFGWFDEKRETLKEIRSNLLVFVLPPFNRQGKSMIWRWWVGGKYKTKLWKWNSSVINFELSDSRKDLSANTDEELPCHGYFHFLCSDGLKAIVFGHVIHIEQNSGQLPKHFVDLLSPGLGKKVTRQIFQFVDLQYFFNCLTDHVRLSLKTWQP